MPVCSSPFSFRSRADPNRSRPAPLSDDLCVRPHRVPPVLPDPGGVCAHQVQPRPLQEAVLPHHWVRFLSAFAVPRQHADPAYRSLFSQNVECAPVRHLLVALLLPLHRADVQLCDRHLGWCVPLLPRISCLRQPCLSQMLTSWIMLPCSCDHLRGDHVPDHASREVAQAGRDRADGGGDPRPARRRQTVASALRSCAPPLPILDLRSSVDIYPVAFPCRGFNTS